MNRTTCSTIAPWGNGCVKLAGHHLPEGGNSPRCEDSIGHQWCGYCRRSPCDVHGASPASDVLVTNRMPNALRQRTVRDLGIGETGWLTPWQVEVNRDGTPFLPQDAPIKKRSGGTACVSVLRSLDGLVVDLRHTHGYHWPTTVAPHGLPVHKALWPKAGE